MKKFLISVFALSILILSCASSFAGDEEWICSNCGTKNNANFCTNCGNKRPEEIICPNCGEKYPLSSGVRFCGKCGTKLQSDTISEQKYEGEGFYTPEEAVNCYLEGIKNLDFEKILSAFAWERQSNFGSPSREIKDIRSEQIDLLCNAIESYALHSSKKINKRYAATIKNERDFNNFLRKLSEGRLKRLSKLPNVEFLSL